VDGEIFESGKKKLRIQKYPDTCGRGLSGKKNTSRVSAANEKDILLATRTSNSFFKVRCNALFRHKDDGVSDYFPKIAEDYRKL